MDADNVRRSLVDALLYGRDDYERIDRCLKQWGESLRTAAPSPSGGGRTLTDDLVDRFSAALKAKLNAAAEKYGYGDAWVEKNWQAELVKSLQDHVKKGDPRDVAAYCAFAWHHGWSVSPMCKTCGGSGIEEVYGGHGNVKETPCPDCQPPQVLP